MAREAELVGAPTSRPSRLEPSRRRRRRPSSSTAARCCSPPSRSIVLAAFLSPLLRTVTLVAEVRRTRSRGSARRSGRPIPGTFEYEGEDARRLPRAACPTGRRGSWRWSTRAARRAASSTRPTRRRRPITWQGSWRALEQSVGVRAAVGELRRGLGRASTSRACCSTPLLWRVIGRDRDDRVVHARGVRIRAIPVPGPRAPVPPAAVDDLPAGGSHPHPDLHDLREPRLGRARGCRCWSRHSSRTRTTCSCCASTS